MAGESYFTLDSFGTVAIAAAAIVVSSNALRKATGLTTPLIPFVMSLVVGYLAAGAFAGKLQTPPDWIVAFLNSCLLFCTATGGQEVIATGAAATASGNVTRQSATPLPFWSSWLRA